MADNVDAREMITNCLTAECRSSTGFVAHISACFSVANTNNKGTLLIACPLRCRIIITLSNGDGKVGWNHPCNCETIVARIDPSTEPESGYGH